jgi:putative two-component system response regulator
MQHVLVVDHPSICAKIEIALAPTYRTSAARDGEDAIRLLDRDLPDLVLLEAALPGMSGVELAAHVVERGLPAIVASPEPAICARLDRLGWPYLRKPFAADILLGAIRETLAMARERKRIVRESLLRFATISGELHETIDLLRDLRERVHDTLARSRRQDGRDTGAFN